MREAVGGSMLFYIILIFLFIYIIFIGFIMNYAATYRASNYVITSLEQTEGSIAGDLTNNGKLCANLRGKDYHNKVMLSCYYLENNPNESPEYPVYKVKTFISFNLPLIGITQDFPIVNETKTFYSDVSCEIPSGQWIEACNR